MRVYIKEEEVYGIVQGGRLQNSCVFNGRLVLQIYSVQVAFFFAASLWANTHLERILNVVNYRTDPFLNREYPRSYRSHFSTSRPEASLEVITSLSSCSFVALGKKKGYISFSYICSQVVNFVILLGTFKRNSSDIGISSSRI